MSRIGKLPVPVPAGVTVEVKGRTVHAKGPKGSLERELPPHVDAEVAGGAVVIRRNGEDRAARSMHGLARSLIRNLVTGVGVGYTRALDIIGVGYRVENKRDYLVFTLGYSHPIYFEVPQGLTSKIENNQTRVVLSGADRQVLGEAAAKIRSFRPPEPYKGKGIKYETEAVRRKEGKSGAR